MASPFSSSSDIDDSAVDILIAEAADLCALEQIAALNTAHLSDSPLPSNLENRFQKLKSFPQTAADEEKENVPRSLNRRSESEPRPTPCPKPEEPSKAEADWSPEIREERKPRPRESPSPPRLVCWCFGCSPRRMQRRGTSVDDDETLSELGGSAAMKKHRRKLKEAWREQEKASREAEKMVKWVKQVSARINEVAIDELLKEEFK